MDRKVAVVAVGLVVVVAAASFLAPRGVTLAPVGPEVSSTPPGVASGRSVAEAMVRPIDEVRTAAPAVGVHGILLDDEGAPLPGVLVYLRAQSAVISGSEMRCTDAAGQFHFAQATGAVRLTVEGDLVPAEEFEVVDVEQPLTLRAVVPCLVLEGIVWRGDEPVRDRYVRAKSTDTPERPALAARTDVDGCYRLVLRVGVYALEVHGSAPGFGADPPLALPHLSMGSVTMTAAMRRVRHDLHLPGSSLRVQVVRADDGRAVADAAVALRPEAGAPRVGRTNAQGEVVFHELTAGTWTATLAGAAFVPAQVTCGLSGRGRHDVRLAATVAGGLGVVLHRDGMEPMQLIPGHGFDPCFELRSEQDPLAPPLQFGGSRSPVDPSEIGPSSGIAFPRLAPGLYELRCCDRVVDGQMRYAPVEPFVRQGIAVRAGKPNLLEIQGVPRLNAFVAVVDANKTAWMLPMTWTGPHGPVHVDSNLGTYDATVPPGEYTMVVTAPSGTIEQRFVFDATTHGHHIVVPGVAPSLMHLLGDRR